jgi:hypothetical protein
MVEDSENIIFYYLKEKGDKSGVAIIYTYAEKRMKRIFNLV